MLKSEKVDLLSEAFVRFQSTITDAIKDKQGYGYVYADLHQVLNIVRPKLSLYDLSLLQCVSGHDNMISVESILLHKSGQFISSKVDMPIEQQRGMSIVQSAGTLISYLRRYCMMSLLGLASHDNDGHIEKDESPGMIDSDQVNTIQQLALSNDINIGQILKAYDIDSLYDLERDKYDECIQRIKLAATHRKSDAEKRGVV